MKINENLKNSPSNRVLTKNRVTNREVKYNMIDRKNNNQENSSNTAQNNIVYKREYKYKYSNRENNNNNNSTKQENRYKRSPINYNKTENKIEDKNLKNRKENKIDITFNFNLTNFNCNDSNKNKIKNKKLIEDYSEKLNSNSNVSHIRKLSEYYTKIKPMNSNSILNIKVNTKNNSASKENNNTNNNRVVSTNGNVNRNNKSNIIYCSYKNLCSYEKLNNTNISTTDSKLTNKIPIFEKKNYLSKNNTEKYLFDKNKKEKNENYDKLNNLTHCSSKVLTNSKTDFTPYSSNAKKTVSKIKQIQEDKEDKSYSNRPIYKSKCKSSFNSKSVRMQTESNLMENPEINFFNIVKLIQASKENVD